MTAHPPIQDLPQLPETWHLGIRELQLGLPTDPNGFAYPAMILFNWDTRNVQAFEVFAGDPKSQDTLEFIQNAFSNPSEDQSQPAHRPQYLLLENEGLVAALQAPLATLGIQVQLTDRLDIIDQIVNAMEREIKATLIDIPGLLTGKGVTADLVRDVFTAAADFYMARPWEALGADQVLKVRILPRGRNRYILVLGQGGVQYGLVQHKRIEDFALIQTSLDPLSEIPPDGWHTFSFERQDELPEADLEAILKYKWPVMDEAAYPLPVTYLKTKVKRPDQAELNLYAAVLRAIPDFVAQYLDSDGAGDYLPVEAELKVETLSGPVSVAIAYQPNAIPDYQTFFDPAILEDSAFFDDDEPFDDFAYYDDAIEVIRKIEQEEEGDDDADDGISDPQLQHAEDLIQDAYLEDNPHKRIQMAHQALKISPHCVSAYILLADEEARTIEEAHELFKQGVAAGASALGTEFFELHRGDFWDYDQARPYLEALMGMANMEWELDRTQEALQHYQELLALNPYDHYGVRYSLLNLFISLGRDADALALIERYRKDPFSDWVYSRALLLFHEQGDSPAARKALKIAVERNPHVPTYLTGEKRLPKRIPNSIGLGDRSEAIHYVSGNLSHWRQTPGALPWLQKQIQDKR